MSQRRYPSRFTREIVAMAEEAGLHAEPLRSGHWKITTAEGAWVTNVAGTSSDRKAVLPIRAAIRRAARAARAA